MPRPASDAFEVRLNDVSTGDAFEAHLDDASTKIGSEVGELLWSEPAMSGPTHVGANCAGRTRPIAEDGDNTYIG